jgi:formylglycine-generating enzyme required for sulfatase activity
VELEQRLLVLADTAWALFQAHPAEKVFTFREWDKAMRTACGTQEVAEIATFATALRTDLVEAGLLVSPSTGRWMFLPRTFFEYLAAVGLVNQAAGSREVVAALGPRLSDPPSREVVLLAIAHLGVIVRDPRLASAVVAALLAWETDPAGHGVALVGEAVAEIVPAGAALVGLSKTARDQLVSTLLRDMRDDARVKAVERVACGDALAKLGDTRFHQEDLWCLPNDDHLGFLRVPAGPFPMGSDKSSDREALDDEVPQHPVVLAAFYIARWPVTVAQFQLFMKATGRTRELPSDWESDQGPANHPVVSVKWHDGQAYAKWLTKQMREAATRKNLPDPLLQLFAEPEPWRVRLASEAEWEKAARGSDGWTYPWGNEADPERANYRETGIGDTSAVGCFRGGGRKMAEDAPLGVEELAGNVWEWTRSKWVERYPYVPGDGREEEGGDEPRVLRGGSFLINRRFVRAANRDLIAPVDRSYNFGCRVVLSPFDFDL